MNFMCLIFGHDINVVKVDVAITKNNYLSTIITLKCKRCGKISWTEQIDEFEVMK